VCLLLTNFKKNGVFVEVGVGNGEAYSNTLLLERNYNWDGVLCEPSKGFHSLIRANRRARLDVRAVSSQSGHILTFEEDKNIGELSGLRGSRTGRGAQTIENYEVDTITLDDALVSHGIETDIDFVSIDTEGSELAVLEGFDFKKWHVKFFVIEHSFDPIRIREYQRIFGEHGYIRILPHISSFDSWYLRNDLFEDHISNGFLKN
jgi:FkbM family methyltransferase